MLLRTSDVEKYRQLFLNVHAEVRGDFGLMNQSFNAVDRFDERLSRYASRPGWEAVIAFDGDEPAGYVFGVPLAPGSLWWSTMHQAPTEEFTTETGSRTFAVNEVLVREAHRGTAGRGASRALHEKLLAERTEARATLLVDPGSSGGRVKAVYESWGYRDIGPQQPFDDSPTFATMLRDPLHR
ncbi:N-acetyltransferase [Streptomyces sp. NPDC088789]|uniref:N-acetyltransferase n=1 Tax=Streptomyces sp. NPDC088789 TaxID=3365899 RepID=UPI00381CDCDC